MVDEHPKYSRPNVFLVDLDSAVATTLQAAGYHVMEGTFGSPYRVPLSNDYAPVIPEHRFPLLSEESDVVIIDLADGGNLLESAKSVPPDLVDYWAKASYGYVDPRPLTGRIRLTQFDRILKYGGAFVVFAAPVIPQTIVHFEKTYPISTDFNLWSFLSVLTYIRPEARVGTEISVRGSLPFCELLRKYSTNALFTCILPVGNSKNWIPFAFNRFDECVAAIGFFPTQDERTGTVLVVPQIYDKASFLGELLDTALPDIQPCAPLFPNHIRRTWLHDRQYEVLSVVQLNDEIEKIERDTEQRIADIRSKIDDERERHQFLYDLLSETGDSLVQAVKTAFEVLGFQNVVDMDEERKTSGDSVKREDLQIRDRSPLVLVEVKGLGGRPSESDALEVRTYLGAAAKKLNRTDLRGLSIINQERYLPALDRTTPVFTEDTVTNAENDDIGLLTTFDLFRLVRGFLRYSWKHSDIQNLFYQSGIVSVVPDHYEFAGVVEHFWSNINVVGFALEVHELCVGDTIAFEFPVDFEEEDVTSIHIDDKPVECANKSEKIGVKTRFSKDELRPGTRIYRVRK